MFGTLAKWRIKPGAEAYLVAQAQAMRHRQVPGWLSTTVHRDVNDPQLLWVAVVFESEDAYRRNADDPLQNVEYERLLAAMDGPPEWHDGQVLALLGPQQELIHSL